MFPTVWVASRLSPSRGTPNDGPLFIPLCEWWHLHFKDIMAPAPEILPPPREVNHHITLLDPNKHYIERWATCPQALKGQLQEKAKQYEHTE